MKPINRLSCIAAALGFCFMSVGGAYAQIYTINSVVTEPRVYNDIPGASLTTTTTVSGYPSIPSLISFAEQNVSAPSGYANRDMWKFSSDGSSPYVLAATDTGFTASFDLTLGPDTGTIDSEAGWIIQNANGTFPGGDMQFIAKASQDHFLGFFGGPGFWNSGIPYTAGSTVTMTMVYWQSGATGNMQFSVNAGSGAILSPIQSWSGNLVGDTLGAYFQIQNDPNNPSNGAQATFTKIGLTPVPEPSLLAVLGLGILPLTRLLRRRV